MRAELRHVLAVTALAALACACGASGPPAPPVQPTEERQPFTEYTVPGVTLWTVSGPVEDHGWSSVVGVEPNGHVLTGTQLFLRAVTPGLPPETVATRSKQTLGIEGGILHVAEDSGQFGSPAVKALIAPPSVTDGVLTMWMLVGEMSPRVSRVQVTLATGDVVRTDAQELVPPTPPTPPPGASGPPDAVPGTS